MLFKMAMRPIRAGSVAVAAMFAFLLSGCQDTTDVGAANRCGSPVEVTANDVDRLPEEYWERMDHGRRVYIGTMAESDETLYVWVRSRRDNPIVQFTVPVAELRTPPPNANYDTNVTVELEVVLEKDRCP